MALAFGKYRLLAELGHGGMADVFLAALAGPAGTGFSKLMVIKRLRANIEADDGFMTMLVDEARIAARLNHPNLVQTNEVGEVDGQYFIAMEFLDGQPMHRVRRRAKEVGVEKFPIAMEYLILADTLAGLQYAHEMRDYDGTPLEIVHRDVTPQNIFITYDGHTKVVDFGIAKATGRTTETTEGVIKGKVRYMSPEQATLKPVDRRSDIFAVGVLLWEAATGRRFWGESSDIDIFSKLMSGNYEMSPMAVDPTVPPAIDAICRRALALNPSDRYDSSAEMKNDIEKYLSDAGLLLEMRSKLSPALTEMFSVQRQKLAKLIEEQLSSNAKSKIVKLSVDSSGMATPVSQKVRASQMSLTPLPGATPSGIPANEDDVGTRVSTTQDSLQFTARSSGSAPPRKPVLAVVLTLLGITAVAGGSLVMSQRHTTIVDANLPVPSSSQGAGNAAPTTPEVTIQLRATPPEARILVDGILKANPFIIQMAKDTRVRRIKIEADGYEPLEAEMAFDQSTERGFTLTPRPTPPPTTTAVGGRPPKFQGGRRDPATSASNVATPATSATAVATDSRPASSNGLGADLVNPRDLPRGKSRGDIDKSVPWK